MEKDAVRHRGLAPSKQPFAVYGRGLQKGGKPCVPIVATLKFQS